MGENEQENEPVKLTITFADGHTEDHNVFMGVAAKGIVPADKIDNRVFYMAPEEGFSTQGFSAIAATSEVVAGLLNTMVKLLTTCLESLTKDDPIGVIEILEAMDELSSKSTSLYIEAQTIRKDISGN